MIENLKKLQNLEDYVALKVKYLKLQDDFKFLVSSVSHDLTSPLGYLKFSVEILNSQLDKSENKEWNETLNVITSSTSKLSDVSNKIIEEAKSVYETKEEFKPIKNVVIASLELCGIDFDKDTFKGAFESELKIDFHLNMYWMSSLIILFPYLGLKVNTIKIEENENQTLIEFNLHKIKFDKFKKLDLEVSKLLEKELSKSLLNYLKAEVKLYNLNAFTVIHINYIRTY